MSEATPAPKLDRYLDPYRDALRVHGPSFEATLWMSRQKQRQRFRIFSKMTDFTGRVVLDAGCGLGDLAAWFLERGIDYGAYIGMEALPEFIEQARVRALPETRFVLADFVGDADAFDSVSHAQHRFAEIDLVVFSGSLNTLSEEEAWEVVLRAWRVAQEGVLFNFLSSRDHQPPRMPRTQPSPARRFDPVALVARALEVTPRVALRHDYMGGHDATIAMFKPSVAVPETGADEVL